MILKTLILIICILGFNPHPISAKEDVSLKIYTNKNTLSLDENFIIYVEVRGLTNKDFKLQNPLLEKFILTKADRHNKFIEKENSSGEIVTLFRYLTEPIQEGPFLIGPFSLKHDDILIKSNKCLVNITPAPFDYKSYDRDITYLTSDESKIQQDFKIQTNLSKTILYEGEPLKVDFIFTSLKGADIKNFKLIPASLNNFIKEKIPSDIAPVSFRKNNKVFNKRQESFIVIPQKKDNNIIEAAKAKFDIMLYDDLNNDYVLKEISLKSEPVDIKIKPLPPIKKDYHLLGVLEDVKIQISTSKNKIKINESFSITTSITARGFMQKHTIPAITDNQSFEVFLTEDKITYALDDKNNFISVRKISHKIIPKETGSFKLQSAKLTYFSKLKETYIKLPSIDFDILIKDSIKSAKLKAKKIIKQTIEKKEQQQKHRQKNKLLKYAPLSIGATIALLLIFLIIRKPKE